jgi:CRISPR-associated protein Csb2
VEDHHPYVVTRHAKGGVAAVALTADVLAECRRLGLPEPRVESSNVRGVPEIGLTGDIRLTFGQSVLGPVLLGRTRHVGGGLLRPVHGDAR